VNLQKLLYEEISKTVANRCKKFQRNENKDEQEAPQCDETRFSTIQPSIDVTGIRNARWQ